MSDERRPVGFVPGKWGRAAPNPPMLTPDLNADLLGFAFPVAGGVATVTGTASWSPVYVTVDTPAGPSCRVAAQVRRRKELL